MDTNNNGQRLFLMRLGIGLVQGLALYLLYQALDAKTWPATNGLFFAPLLLVSLYLPLLLNQALGAMPLKPSLVWAGVALVALAVLGFFANWMAGADSGEVYRVWGNHGPLPSAALLFYGGGGLFIAHALVVGGVSDHRIRARFTTHFDVAWKMAVQLALAALFVGVFWLLLWLGAALFNLIQLNFLEKLIQHDWFWIPATTLAAAGALHLTDIRPALVEGARTLLLTLLSWLLPLIVLIVAGFVASLPFTGLAALWKTGHGASLLLAATAALILLTNAAYQDGAAERMPPRLLRWAGTAAAVLMLPLAAIAGYAVHLRVSQYGWSVDRVIVTAIDAAALAYAVGYLRAAVSPGRWLAHIEAWNFTVALLILVLLVALFTPIASPARIAVNDQMARLASGRTPPEKFDYAFLRWQGGRYGRAALATLAQSPNQTIRTAARDAQKETSRYGLTSQGALKGRITVYPQDRRLPDSFLAQKWEDGKDNVNTETCLTNNWLRCDAVLADADGDGHEEVVLLASNVSSVDIYRDTGGGHWERVAQSNPPCGNKLFDDIKDGHFTFVPPASRWKDIMVGGRRLQMRDIAPTTACPQ